MTIAFKQIYIYFQLTQNKFEQVERGFFVIVCNNYNLFTGKRRWNNKIILLIATIIFVRLYARIHKYIWYIFILNVWILTNSKHTLCSSIYIIFKLVIK